MKRYLYILAALLLPLIAAAEVVRIPNYYCCAGNEFTIRIPVNAGGASVWYQWYRDDAAVTQKLLLPPGEKVVAYTIPALLAHGDSVRFYFAYCLDDDHPEVWTRSPTYLMTFPIVIPQALAVAGDTAVCASRTYTYSTADALGVRYDWEVPEGWAIAAGQGTHRITVTAGAGVGIVSVTARNGCGIAATPSTLEIAAVHPSIPFAHTGGDASQTVCMGGSITPIAYTWSKDAVVAGIKWSPNNGGMSYSVDDTTGTISGTPTSFGEFTYTITTTASCVSPATGTITCGGMVSGGTTALAADTCSGGVTSGGTTTLADYTCSDGITSGGTTALAADTCSDGIMSGGATAFAALSCSGGITSGGTIAFAAGQ